MADSAPDECNRRTRSRRPSVVPLVLLAVSGCLVGAGCRRRSPIPPDYLPLEAPVIVTASPLAGQSAEVFPRATPPSSHVEVRVRSVVSTAAGANVVLLSTPEQEVLVPIFVGSSEAMVIELRMDHQLYDRPLTHDLLDHIMRELRGRVDRVQVDELRDNVFIGTVFIRDGTRLVMMDARASDAIALALGNDAPIFMARDVVKVAGVRREDIARRYPTQPREPQGGAKPLSL